MATNNIIWVSIVVTSLVFVLVGFKYVVTKMVINALIGG